MRAHATLPLPIRHLSTCIKVHKNSPASCACHRKQFHGKCWPLHPESEGKYEIIFPNHKVPKPKTWFKWTKSHIGIRGEIVTSVECFRDTPGWLMWLGMGYKTSFKLFFFLWSKRLKNAWQHVVLIHFSHDRPHLAKVANINDIFRTVFTQSLFIWELR